jgi:hypothetical protein
VNTQSYACSIVLIVVGFPGCGTGEVGMAHGGGPCAGGVEYAAPVDPTAPSATLPTTAMAAVTRRPVFLDVHIVRVSCLVGV